MLDFHAPAMEDRLWVEEVLSNSKHWGCLYTFAQFALWADKYNSKICRLGDALSALSGINEKYYVYPAGRYDVREAINVLKQDADERGIPLRFCAVEEWQKDELMAAFPDRFEAVESRNDFDYIYKTEDLAELSGRKYHSKRNHIAKFTRHFPDWSYEQINAANIAECIEMEEQWCAESGDDADLQIEKQIIIRALNDMQGYGLDGGLIRLDGKVIAFTIAEPLNNNICDIHFEKALREYAEAYTIINKEYASRLVGRYEYINREEDLGIEGLRKAKLSYKPSILLKKYVITEVK